jgi:YesN/AraC family two-component response regulator
MKQILLVDDEKTLLDGISEFLKLKGFAVATASNGAEAVALFKSDLKVDLLITDIIMPEKDGIELILYTKSKVPGCKIIAVSGGGRISPEDYLLMAKGFKVNDTIQKPFAFSELDAKIKKIFA